MYKCKECGKNVRIVLYERIDRLCAQCGLLFDLRDEKKIKIHKMMTGLSAAISVLATIIFLIGMLYFRQEMTNRIAYPGKQFPIGIRIERGALTGAMKASEKGKFVIVNSNSELFKTDTVLIASPQENRADENAMAVKKAATTDAPRDGHIMASISIPSYDIPKPINIRGYLLMPYDVAQLSASSSFHHAPIEVKSEEFSFTIYPRERVPRLLIDFMTDSGLIAIVMFILFVSLFSDYRKFLKTIKQHSAI